MQNGRIELLGGVLVALIALIGVLIGDILQRRSANETLKQTQRLERERWDREDRRRHEESRHQAYPVFLAVVDEGVLGLSDHLRHAHPPDTPFAGPGWDQRLREALAVIEFVGTSETIDTAQALYRAAQRLKVGVLGQLRDMYRSVADANDEPPMDVEDLSDAETSVEEASFGSAGTTAGDEDLGEDDDLEGDASEDKEKVGATIGEFMDFVDNLPYPLGGDVAPHRMYSGNPLIQVSMARAELRVRRHEFLNAARADLGMTAIPFPKESRGHLHKEAGDFEEAAADDGGEDGEIHDGPSEDTS